MFMRPLRVSNFIPYNSKTVFHRFTSRFHINIWKNIISITGMDVSVDKDGTRAVVKIPGFSFHDFDRTGRLNIRNIQGTLTAARMLAYHTVNKETGVTFLEYDKLTSDRYTFMASTKTSVNKQLYELTRKDTLVNPPKMNVVIELGYVGRSSLSSVAQLICENTGIVYLDNVNTVVTVDKTTRKPTQLTDWWKEKYIGASTRSEPLVVPLMKVPECTHKYHLKIPWTDIDNYKHTNYVSYIRFCMDAALDAGFGNYYTKVTGDFLDYKVKDMEISYKGESLANEEIVVHTWENAENPFILHFSIERQGQVIFQNTIEVYPKDIS